METMLAIERLNHKNVYNLSPAFVKRELEEMHTEMFEFIDMQSPLWYLALYTRLLFMVLPHVRADPALLYWHLTGYRRALEECFRNLDGCVNPDNDPALAERQRLGVKCCYVDFY